MKHFQHPVTKDIRAFEDDGSQDDQIPEDYTPITLPQVLVALKAQRETVEVSPEDYKDAVRNLFNHVAHDRGYDSILSAVSYINSTNATFQSEAAALIAWRDTVWGIVYPILDQIEAGTLLPKPQIAEVLALLPAVVWVAPEPEPTSP